ncbi:MAG: 3-phosphoshikimate 1-carboxyvinyltransferase [Acidobacteria bacterium]|nr:3-phosphoshikimate 1-carboxyvinyltransferase [Acidobacteriota bacterium]
MSAPRLVSPLEAPPDAVIEVPGSKSLTNRALVAAALAEGTSTISNALVADDTDAMIECLRALGVEIDVDGTTMVVTGMAGELSMLPADLNARLSGTTSRFLLPLLAVGRGRYRLDGDAPLRRRPMGPALNALRDLGARVSEEGQAGHLPVVISGPITGREVSVPGNVSSQFVSGLLLAAPAFPNGLSLSLTTELVAAPFVNMTVAVMNAFGVRFDHLDVPAARYRAREFAVEPDVSNASYFLAAAAITGGRVTVPGIGKGSLQGDVRFIELLDRMGASPALTDDSVSVLGGPLHGIDVDLSGMPDMAQTFAVVAAFAVGASRVRGIDVIRGHETDRIAAVATELRRVGVDINTTEDGWEIHPAPMHGATIRTYDDHRMAMSFALLGLRVPGIEIDDPGCVAKTFPEFWSTFDRLRRR